MVASSSAVMRSEPWEPMHTTSSPKAMSSSSQSTMIWSMVTPPATDQHVGRAAEASGVAVRVSDEDGRDRRIVLGHEVVPVGHALAGVHPPRRAYRRHDAHRRTEVDVLAQPRRRIQAVDGQTHADEVELRVLAADRRDGVADVADRNAEPSPLDVADQPNEPLELRARERVLLFVGHGEVAPEAFDVEPGESCDTRDDVDRAFQR